ncbi:hypothetical protein [Bradyrhizobium uaiense]|uniref:Uncharacterized protein n=1 Tax=Bradyrhizobium uaiense TaxID=2594946 RepID=A0A6P1BMP3_9BRAD|nr:hypothetical protein [Bradyrhizobium uaiense]NEU98881.1 hypothetical protein [Bradyrhizobium uaiense]
MRFELLAQPFSASFTLDLSGGSSEELMPVATWLFDHTLRDVQDAALRKRAPFQLPQACREFTLQKLQIFNIDIVVVTHRLLSPQTDNVLMLTPATDFLSPRRHGTG